MKRTFVLLLLAVMVLAACMKHEKAGNQNDESKKTDSLQPQPEITLDYIEYEPDKGAILWSEIWLSVNVHKSFSAPWSDNRQDQTEFQCYLSFSYLYFRFRVPDKTLTLHDPFRRKLDVCDEDRAEIFLSATAGMDTYYCMEIDPKGRVLDYKANYYRQFDYEWSFSTLQTESYIADGCYIVSGRLSTAELQQLGIPIHGFYMGVFRADFDGPKDVVWYSLLRVEREQADFHIPEMLFLVKKEPSLIVNDPLLRDYPK